MRECKDGWALLVPGKQGWRCMPVADRAIVGRARDCDIVVEAPGVAGRQCRLQDVGGVLTATDLGTEVETLLRHKPLGPRAQNLHSGDVLRLGRVPVVVVRYGQRRHQPWVQLGDLGSASARMWQTFADLALASATAWPLLLLGESGCGKELAARVVHDRSPRGQGPWVAVNCAALHGDTLLAELFGAVKGAYTGAVESRKGAFERADGGTLFLDEVGELSSAAQACLLRALEVGEIQVLGGPVRKVDVRLVCATHRDLRREVAAGRFRLDLLHRLSVTETQLLPLRERTCDIMPLLEEHLGGLPLPRGSREFLASHAWPGNVREVRNVARRLQVQACYGEPTWDELRRAVGPIQAPGGTSARAPLPPEDDEPPPPRLASADERRRNVADLLARASTLDAWRQSGLPRGTFFRYAKQLRSQMAAC
jgi:two-component system response regulator GlrR